MKRLLILLLIIWSSASHAINTDSMRAVWNNKALPDTIRLNAMHELAKSYMNTNPDSALILARMEFEFALKVKNVEYQKMALLTEGMTLSIQGNSMKALESFSRFLEISGENQVDWLTGICMMELGLLNTEMGNFPKALVFYQKSQEIFEKVGDKHQLASLQSNIGVVYAQLNDFVKALEYYSKSLKFKIETDDLESISKSYLNIGQVYMITGDDVKALEYLTKGREAIIKSGSKTDLGSYFYMTGDLYARKGDYQEAINSFNKGLEIFEELKNIYLGKCLHNRNRIIEH